jgi:hypothetical protein
MRRIDAAAVAILAMLVTWDIASALNERLVESIWLCAFAAVAAVPTLISPGWPGLKGKLWSALSDYSPYAVAGALGLSHFLVKSQPGGTVVLSIVYLVLSIALVETMQWASYTKGFTEMAGLCKANYAWSKAFSGRFLPLFALGIGLSLLSIVTAAGFTGVWTVLALAVLFFVIIVLTAKTAARA